MGAINLEKRSNAALDLLLLIVRLGIFKFPSVNPEELDEYAWRVYEQKSKNKNR